MIEIRDATEKDFEANGSVSYSYMFLGPCYCLTSDSEQVAIVGLSKFWEGTGSIWSYVYPCVKRHKKDYIKAIKYLIEKHSGGLHRIQALVREDDRTAIRFIEYLGFIREGLHKRYDPEGNNYYSYARVQWPG